MFCSAACCPSWSQVWAPVICQCQWVIVFLGVQSLVLVTEAWLVWGWRWPWKGRFREAACMLGEDLFSDISLKSFVAVSPLKRTGKGLGQCRGGKRLRRFQETHEAFGLRVLWSASTLFQSQPSAGSCVRIQGCHWATDQGWGPGGRGSFGVQAPFGPWLLA